MNLVDFEEAMEAFRNGRIENLASKIEPFLQAGDLDARYLNALFSLDPNESGEDFDQRSTNELSDLAALQHANSLYKMAWKFRHGDEVDPDFQKFRSYLTAAALLGQKEAVDDLAAEIELDFGWDDFAECVSRNNRPVGGV